MTPSKSRALSLNEIDRFGMEIEAIKNSALEEVGEKDARYILKIVRIVRYTEFAGRGLLLLSFFPPFWFFF